MTAAAAIATLTAVPVAVVQPSYAKWVMLDVGLMFKLRKSSLHTICCSAANCLRTVWRGIALMQVLSFPNCPRIDYVIKSCGTGDA
jgi:hypothetical protein